MTTAVLEARPQEQIQKLLRHFVSSAEIRRDFQENPEETLRRHTIVLSPSDLAYLKENMDEFIGIHHDMDAVNSTVFFLRLLFV